MENRTGGRVMAQTYININGEMRDASSLTLPPEGRLLRGAWVFNGDAVEIDPVKAKAILTDRVRQEGAERLQAVAADYSEAERETWPTQIEEAEALKADPNAAAPLVRTLADADEITPDAMADAILAKRDAYRAAAAVILAKQRTLLAMDLIPTDFDHDKWWS